MFVYILISLVISSVYAQHTTSKCTDSTTEQNCLVNDVNRCAWCHDSPLCFAYDACRPSGCTNITYYAHAVTSCKKERANHRWNVFWNVMWLGFLVLLALGFLILLLVYIREYARTGKTDCDSYRGYSQL